MSSVETRIARILTVGTRFAVALLAIGSVLLVAGGTSPLAADWPPLDLASLPRDLAALQPAAFLWLGLIATIATPLVRVAASTWSFARAGEPRLAGLGVAVLVVIALAIVAGSMAG
jgi:uncharacterized membrane protein